MKNTLILIATCFIFLGSYAQEYWATYLPDVSSWPDDYNENLYHIDTSQTPTVIKIDPSGTDPDADYATINDFEVQFNTEHSNTIIVWKAGTSDTVHYWWDLSASYLNKISFNGDIQNFYMGTYGDGEKVKLYNGKEEGDPGEQKEGIAFTGNPDGPIWIDNIEFTSLPGAPYVNDPPGGNEWYRFNKGWYWLFRYDVSGDWINKIILSRLDVIRVAEFVVGDSDDGVHTLDTLVIYDCNVDTVLHEGINATMANLRLYDNRQIGNSNFEWFYDANGKDETQAGGDGIQIGPGPIAYPAGGNKERGPWKVVIKRNNIHRHETGNKMTIFFTHAMYWHSEFNIMGSIAIIEDNDITPPKDTIAGQIGGSNAFAFLRLDSLFFQRNRIWDGGQVNYDTEWPGALGSNNYPIYSRVEGNVFEGMCGLSFSEPSAGFYGVNPSTITRKVFLYNNSYINTRESKAVHFGGGASWYMMAIYNGDQMSLESDVKNGLYLINEPYITHLFNSNGNIPDTTNCYYMNGNSQTWNSHFGITSWENGNLTPVSGGRLHNNGGSTPGLNLYSGSLNNTYDMYGTFRISGESVDVGAVEFPEGSQSNLPPVIEDQEFDVDENSSSGTEVGMVEATDPDAGQTITWSITGGNIENAFTINSSNGSLTVSNGAALNYEQTQSFNLSVKVQDNGPGNMSSTATVTVNLNDVNEVPEMEDQTFQIEETISNGELVGMVEATDPDEGQELTWSITAGNNEGAFTIDAATGELTIADNSVLNINITPQYSLTVEVEDNGTGNLSTEATMTVLLMEVNLSPEIEDQEFGIEENVMVGSQVGVVEATDPNAGQILTFSIVSGNTEDAFAILPQSGQLLVVNADAINYEENPQFLLEVEVEDNGVGNLSSQATVTVNLTDVNEVPEIEDQSFQIEETIATGAQVGMVEATDPDVGQTLTWTITSGNVDGAFAMDAATGELSIADNTVLNFSVTPQYTLTVEVEDNGPGNLSADATVTVELQEVNLAPVIEDQQFSIDENQPDGSQVGTVEATDPNAGQTLSYSIVSGNLEGAFSIGTTSGILTVANSEALNHEQTAEFYLIVEVSDDGAGNLSDLGTVTVQVNDINEPPVMDDQNFVVEEGIGTGEQVGMVQAEDPDAGQALTWSITAGNDEGIFAVDGSTGALSIADNSALNFSQTPVYFLDMQVQDNGTGELTDEAVIAVSTDELNQAPSIENQQFSIEENSAAGTLIGQVEAIDPDAGQTLTYSIVSGNVGSVFALNPQSGDLTVDNSEILNYEQHQSFSLTVKVEDDGIGNLSDEATVTVEILDVNEVPVVEETIFSLQENSPEGTQVGQVTAQDPDAGQQVSYAIISGNIEGSFTIDNVSGMVSIANAAGVNFETTPVFYLVVEATDNGAGSLSGQGVITINVDDINEVPVIEDQYFTAEASSPEGSQVGEVEAMDPDNGQELTYSILSGNTQDAFTIDGSSGMITVSNSAALNMTVNPIFILQVEVEDNGTGNLTAQASVVIVLMNPTSVGETFSGDFNCSLYPNPATTQVNLEVNIPQGEELSIQVIDFMGQVVHQETHPASAPRITTQLQVASYEGGMYVIVLRSGEHLKQLKLIKQ